jgi:GT2 family glycosyltransferase
VVEGEAGKFEERDKAQMHVAAVIVNYRTPELTMRALASLNDEREFLPDLEALVVDNASGDHSVRFLASALADSQYSGWVSFVELPINGGFGWGNNQAILRLMTSPRPPDAVLLLNPDAILKEGALCALMEDMQLRENAGAIGSQLLDEDGALSGSAFHFPTPAMEFARGVGLSSIGRILRITPVMVPHGLLGPVDWVTGASVLLRVQALRQSGLFDTGFFLYFEEVELMHRMARSGWKIYRCPKSLVIHTAGASTGVVDGKQSGGKAPPSYVFRSRHRYFALTGGWYNALCADLAWIVGYAISACIRLVTFKRKSAARWDEFKAFIREGIGSRPEDCESAVAQIDDQIGERPSWLKR